MNTYLPLPKKKNEYTSPETHSRVIYLYLTESSHEWGKKKKKRQAIYLDVQLHEQLRQTLVSNSCLDEIRLW